MPNTHPLTSPPMLTRSRLSLLSLVVVLAACGLGTPGDGEKIGQIVRVNTHGIFCKSHEAQIMRGGFSNGSGTTGGAFDFTIESDSLAALAEKYMRTQREVVIRYRSEGIYAECRTESGGDFLVSIDTTPTPAAATR